MNKIYQKPFSGEKNAGFTLIELLVVVLIIGILSSIALPQYTKAVEKARATEVWVEGRALLNALSVYKLANDYYPVSLEGVGIEVPEMKNFSVRYLNRQGQSTLRFQGKQSMANYIFEYDLDRKMISCLDKQSSGRCPSLMPCSSASCPFPS